MLRIGLAYMNVSNLGDVTIYETARYLVERILQSLDITQYQIVSIDIGSYHSRQYSYSFLKRVRAAQERWNCRRLMERSVSEKQLERALRRQWHLSKEYLYFVEKEKEKLIGLDLLIFTGGGLIKFHQQNFHYFLDEITQFADQHRIPVFLNAVGVEGYDEENPECRLLKRALNRDCVKYVSTRDDWETLTRNYITAPHIQTESVCDPALWTQECYQIGPEVESHRIGLGVIRPKIFRDYMYYVDKNLLIDMYFALARRLVLAGYQVEFFSNGVEQDHRFLRQILTAYPSLSTTFHVTVKRPESSADLVHTIAGYDRFLAVRLHASIIGCSLGIPNLNLIWNKKQILFGQRMGLSENYVTRENFDDEFLFRHLLSLKKPNVDPDYKQSIYDGLYRQISQVLKGSEDERV